jgi:RNA polymerase sigma-70 factor, ECF subfamily
MESSERRSRFEHEMLAHLDGLYAFALRLARNRHDAEDLVSDTVLRALDRWEQYQLDTNIRGWLFTILYHVFVNRRRKIESRETPLDSESGSPALEPIGDGDPEGRFYDSFVDEEITRAIEALPEQYRTAVVLSDVHGFSYHEMAEILGVPDGTVKSRLFRGRQALQRELMGYAVEMGYLRPRAA